MIYAARKIKGAVKKLVGKDNTPAATESNSTATASAAAAAQ